MTRAALVALALVFVSIPVVFGEDLRPAWLTEEVTVFALVMLATAFVSSVLGLYFDWRRRLIRRLQG